MKKTIWLAIIGAAALTGCQNEVMQQRSYVPAPSEDAAAVKTDNAASVTEAPGATLPAAEARPAEPAKSAAQAPAPAEMPTMTKKYNDDGVSDDTPMDGGAAAGTYIVKKGDTLGGIARRHHVSTAALMKANNISPDGAKKLHVGKKLVIPARSAKSGRGARSGRKDRGAKRSADAAPAPAAAAGEYIVKSGDTPEKIARKHHVRLAALMEANKFSEEDAKRLRVGQKIVIPGRSNGKAPAAAARGKAAPVRGKAAPAAKTAQATAPQAKAAPAPAKSAPETAEEAVPAPAPAPAAAERIDFGNSYLVTVEEDMTVDEFANRNNTTVEALRNLNPTMPADRLVKGNHYQIPKN